jgi:hypothetical protein
MSGTASLSAAKNRRSGNEVKFNGQPKQPIPYQNMPQQYTSQQNVKQMQPPPHPLVILKSHELRLQKIETNDNPELDYSNLIKDFISHKEDYLRFKQDYTLFKNSIKYEKNISDDNSLSYNSMQVDNSMQLDNSMQVDNSTEIQKSSNLEGNILSLHSQIDDIHKLITSISLELSSITQHYKSKDNKCDDTVTLDKLILDKLILDKLIEQYKEKDIKEKDIKEKDIKEKDNKSTETVIPVIPDRFVDIDIHDNFCDKIQSITTEESNIQLEILDSNHTTTL